MPSMPVAATAAFHASTLVLYFASAFLYLFDLNHHGRAIRWARPLIIVAFAFNSLIFLLDWLRQDGMPPIGLREGVALLARGGPLPVFFLGGGVGFSAGEAAK